MKIVSAAALLLFVALSLPAAEGEGLPFSLPASGKGRLKVARLTTDMFVFEEVRADVRVDGGKVYLEGITALALGGKVRGKGEFDLTQRPPSFRLDLDLFDCSAEELKRTLRAKTFILAGVVAGHITVEGRFTKPLTLKVYGPITMKGRAGDMFRKAEALLHYEKRRVELKEIAAEEFGGGRLTGEVVILVPKGGRATLTGTLKGERVSIAAVTRMLGKKAPWLSGRLDGVCELRLCLGKHPKAEKCLTTGRVTGCELDVRGLNLRGECDFDYDGESLAVRNFRGSTCGGKVECEALFSKGMRIRAKGEGVLLEQALDQLGVESEAAGETDFELSLSTPGGIEGLTGGWYAEVKNGNLSSAPGIMSVVTLLGLPRLKAHEFTEARCRMRMKGSRMIIEEAEVKAKKLTLRDGKGYVDLDGKLHVQFEIYSESSLLSFFLGKLGSALANALDPVSKVFRVEITGTLSEPEASLKAFGKKIDTEEESGGGKDEGKEKEEGKK